MNTKWFLGRVAGTKETYIQDDIQFSEEKKNGRKAVVLSLALLVKCIVYQCIEYSRKAWNCKGNIKLLVFRLECPNNTSCIQCEDVLFNGLITMTLHMYLHLKTKRKKTTSTSIISMAQVISH
jgi:hypothetical protein